jgi:hypothetical protein
MKNQILDENFKHENLNRDLDKKITAQINTLKIYIDASIRDIKTGRNTLIVVGVFYILASTINIFYNSVELSKIQPLEAILKATFYIACAIGVKFNPKLSLILGLSFYILVQLFNGFADINLVLSWILIKIPIVYFLISSISASFKLLKNSEKLLMLGVPEQEIELIKKLKEVPMTQ